MTMLLTNDRFESNGLEYRLLHVDTQAGDAYIVQLGGDGDPTHRSIEALEAMCADKRRFRLLPEIESQRPSKATKNDVAIRDKRWSRIKDIVNSPDLWDRDSRAKLLKEHALRVHVSAKTLHSHLRLWWAGGQNKDALLGSYYRSGRVFEGTTGAFSVQEKTASGPLTVVFAPAKHNARGRRPKDGVHSPFPISAELRKVLLDSARKHYEADSSKSVRGATTAVMSKHFALRDSDGKVLLDEDGAAILKPLGQRPSYKQVRYMLEKTLVVSTTFKRRVSAAEFENNHAPSTGSVLDDCVGAGDVFEIDATVLDIYVVARAHRRFIIGKPAMFLVIDRSTRLIVGFYITLENPSWSEATQAILSISGNWKSLCERLGVHYRQTDWPAQGVMPNRFFGDRADMITYASDALCDGVAVQVTNAPALLSSRKPIVESGIKSVQAPLRQDAPGYEPQSNVTKRRGKKFHRDAAYTLDELAAVMLRIIIAHNRKETAGYQSSPEEILAGHSTSPIQLWNRATRERMGLTSRMPAELLRRKLLPRGIGLVQRDGLHFGGCVYESGDMREWFARASLRGAFEVEISYTKNLVDSIEVHDPFVRGKEHIATLASKSKGFKGYSFAEVKFVLAAKSEKARAAAARNEAHDVALHDGMGEVSEYASSKTKEQTGAMTAGQRLAGGDQLRALEAKERQIELHGGETQNQHYLATHEPASLNDFEDVPDFPLADEGSDHDDVNIIQPVASALQPKPTRTSARSAGNALLGITS